MFGFSPNQKQRYPRLTKISQKAKKIPIFSLSAFQRSVFEQCFQTTKSKHVVQLHEHSWDAQKVYANLVDVYEEDLSASIVASDLRSQITILRLDDKWKKGIENFLQFWLNKILELEQIGDSTICDVTNRQWLVATLSSSNHMSS